MSISVTASSVPFTDALCFFITDCMTVIGKEIDKVSAIKAMAVSANTIFKDCPQTPENIQEVKDVIKMMVAA